MKALIRVGSWILEIFFVGLFSYLGIYYNDPFYYLLATIVASLGIVMLIKNESMPRITFTGLNKKIKDKPNDSGHFHTRPVKIKSFRKLFTSVMRIDLDFLIQMTLLVLVFLYLIIFKLPKPSTNVFFLSFVNALYLYAVKNALYIIFLVILVFVYNISSYLIRFKYKFVKSITNATLNSLKYLIIAPILSYLIAFAVAFGLFNSILLAVNINPNVVKLHTDKSDIKQVIDKTDDNFEIVGITESSQKTFILNYEPFGKYGDFFTNYFVRKYPSKLLLNSTKLNTPVYLVGNKIVVKELDKEIFQSFAPTLVKKLVKRDLSPRYIKDEPDVQIISRQDYLKYREDEINKEIDEIALYIDEAKKELGKIAYNIQAAKNNIATLQGYIAQNTTYRDNEWNYCINATYTYYGLYSNYTYRLYTDSYCQSQRNSRDQKNADYQSEINANQKNLSYYQSQYNILKQYLDQFQNYKVFIEATKDEIPNELGLFEPSRSIRVVLDSVSDNEIISFLETLTHEYIHYTSYVSEERKLPQFFEEGITETIARKVISDQVHNDTNIGYPVIVKIIQAITRKIPLSQLEEVYFTKSEDQLISLLDNAYGKNFYEDSKLYFAIIPYSPPDEALKFANNIMLKIDGPTLEEKDLYSQ